jgi:hypothetical protein
LIKLLNADRCDPVNDKWCEKDMVCDLRNNVCMKKEDIKPTKNTAIAFDTIDDNKVSGTTANIYQLKHTLENKKEVEPISLTIPSSIETNMLKVKSLEELKKLLTTLTQQNIFYKAVSQLV